MKKTILITGATDGIGKLTAEMLASQGHRVLLHGRNASKLESTAAAIGSEVETYLADMSRLPEVVSMAERIAEAHQKIDVLINNAGVFMTPHPRTPHPSTTDGLDTRFVVNTLAPYVLTKRLLPIIPREGRVVNLSSAAQAPIDVDAMAGKGTLDDMAAYAQSKLAITIWTQELAKALQGGPVVVAVNPGSLLASKMVKEGFGLAGNDLSIGANILCKAALDPSFASASGKYFDNDSAQFADPNPAVLDPQHAASVMKGISMLADV